MFIDTIAAIATPLHEGAISIIRLSGIDAIAIADQIFSRNLTKVNSHTVTYGYIIDPDTQRSLDEVLVSVFRAPKTYTREDIVEINCHGGVFVTKQILSLCIAQGAKLAEEGAFTKRAFLNGRIDMTQAEAVMDLIEANDASKSQLALQAIKGSVRSLIDPLKEDLIQMIAQIEVNIDYPEYTDVAQLTQEELLPKAMLWETRLSQLLEESHSGKLIRSGIKTAILGKPNVGKSSLLNALLEEDKAIVTEIAGTTRDIVEGHIRLPDVTLHLIDTAGIRETQDRIEQMGIDKSHQVMREADLLLVVVDASQPLTTEDYQLIELAKEKTHIVVYNKSDLTDSAINDQSIHDQLISQQIDHCVQTSAANGEVHELVDRVIQMFRKHQIAIQQPTFANERHIGLLKQAKGSIQLAIQAMEEGFELDLVVIDIKQAYQCLQDILGESMKKELLDELFSRFCLGK